jgi:phosphopantothenoylcysteine decarboxylase/phosphopantothenate--cysteine ligase
MLIAPCSATSLARLVTGFYDTALSVIACALPINKPLLIAPAMDSDMWEHPAVQRNIQQLQDDGAIIIEPAYGELASGIIGKGRLPEIPDLMNQCALALGISVEQLITSQQHIDIHEEQFQSKPLYGKKVLITAGPTYERIDDVRFIGNYSSGKMGFSLAEIASRLGALVTLISGPVALNTPIGAIKRISVESALDMYDAVMKECQEQDIIIMSAAVADFMPTNQYQGKIKKGGMEIMNLELKKTPDILSEIVRHKKKGQIIVGFALESENPIDYGTKKLKEKGCDMIVINQANVPDSGFSGDKNTISILDSTMQLQAFPPMSKTSCAEVIFQQLIQLDDSK